MSENELKIQILGLNSIGSSFMHDDDFFRQFTDKLTQFIRDGYRFKRHVSELLFHGYFLDTFYTKVILQCLLDVDPMVAKNRWENHSIKNMEKETFQFYPNK